MQDGKLQTPDLVGRGELAVFVRSDATIAVTALTDVRFVLGSAVPHPHDLVMGYYSVHTSEAALAEGEREIARIGRQLRAGGVLSRRSKPT